MSVERYTIEDQVFWTVAIPPPNAIRISLHPVTQGLYRTIIGTNPSRFQHRPDADQRPVDSVSWYDAIRLCNALSLRCGLLPCYRLGRTDGVVEWIEGDGFRLPTGAEWLRAARASKVYSYAGGNSAEDVGWFFRNSGKETQPVGGRRANAFGLFDMSGNVKEWCWDQVNTGGGGDLVDLPSEDIGGPMFSLTAGDRLLRGGSWQDVAALATLDHFDSAPPDRRAPTIGMRVVRDALR